MSHVETIFSNDKILKHLLNVVVWQGGAKPSPVCVEIDMTNKCNHKCPDCTGWKGKDTKAQLSSKIDVIKLISDIKSWGVKSIVFSGGGEPLIDSGTIPAIKHAKKVGLDVGLITNGGLLCSQHHSYCDDIIKNCVWIRVSLDAEDMQTHAKTHGTTPESGEFGRVISGLMSLVSKKKQYKLDCTIGVGYMINKHTEPGMLAAAKLCKEIGVDYIEFRLAHGSSLAPDQSIVAECKAQNTDTFKVLDYKFTNRINNVKYKKCYGQAFTTIIAADAKMYVCCHYRGNKQFCIGDLTKAHITDIWKSDKRNRVINDIDVNKCIPACRCDSFNKILWNIIEPRKHHNFL